MTTPTVVRPLALLLSAVCLYAAGCSPIPSGRFSTLAESSRALATNSSTTYANVLDIERTYMLYNPTVGKDGKLDAESFKPVVRGDDGRVVTFDFGPALELRSAALDALADYAAVLHAFATKDYQEDLDAATQSLGASVANLAKHAVDGGGAAKAGGVLASAVNALGRATTERMRRDGLRTAMDQAQPGVQALADLIATDNGKVGLAVKVMRGGVLRKANALRPREGVARLSFDRHIADVVRESDLTLAELAALSAAAKKIPIAHAELRQSLDDPASAMATLKELVAETKRLNHFYENASKTDDKE